MIAQSFSFPIRLGIAKVVLYLCFLVSEHPGLAFRVSVSGFLFPTRSDNDFFWPSEFRRLPNKFKRSTSEFRHAPCKVNRTTSVSRRAPKKLFCMSSDVRHAPKKLKRMTSESRCSTNNFTWATSERPGVKKMFFAAFSVIHVPELTYLAGSSEAVPPFFFLGGSSFGNNFSA